ncbi:hypothetical protein AB3S75_037056 [Citrus x aurantiifolia]
MYVCIGVWAAKLLICEVEGFFFFLIFLIFLIMDEEGFGVGNEMAPCKSWAQQTEESYQLQLAMALRLSSQAASADDPHFLALSSCDRHTDSAETVSHRFWVNGCLSYFDRILDGFYLIHGMDPYTWSIGTNQRDAGLIPPYKSLKAVDPCNNLSIKVILIDKSSDPNLKELHNRVLSLLCDRITAEEAVHQLANLVCNHMGGTTSTEEEEFDKQWSECAEHLKDCLNSVVLPIGSLSVGLCVHRALLFKVLADLINLPCRIAKGCKYCRRDDASSCLVQIGPDREYLVDLLEDPGVLSKPDSSLNRTASVFVSSPLYHPRFKAVETVENIRSLAKLYFIDNHSPKFDLDDDPSGTAIEQDYKPDPQALFQRASWNVTADRDLQMQNPSGPSTHVIDSSNFIKGPLLRSPVKPFRHRKSHETSAFSTLKPYVTNNHLLMEANLSVMSTSNRELYLEEEGLEIRWSELLIKKKIGEGSFGTVYHAEWRNSDVAVKILIEQEFHEDRFKEFLREVAIMKGLRHPNIVLLMGAVTEPPNLSIVTEYLSRGSLYKLLHIPDARVVVDERLRLNMAYDVAKGMNYLHQRRPPIVHRDLKSPNLLVDSTYTVKVCDFGLSRSKPNTYISSKTAAGTPEWMAPEVLREDPSNEKSDVFSFGVILWELITLQKPWRNSTPSQVISAVGFKGRRLEIPKNVNPMVAALIETCWAEEPEIRPSFPSIMETLQQLLMSSPLSAQPL